MQTGTQTDAAGSLLVGLAGASGVGKSSVSGFVAVTRPGTATVKLDDFFRERDTSATHVDRPLYNSPENLRFDELAATLRLLKEGKPAMVPRYSRTEGRRIGQFRVGPAKTVLVEGFLLFWHPEVRRLLDLRIYFDAPTAEQRRRRVLRDHAGGVPSDDVYYDQVVVPNYTRFAHDARRHAQHVMSGDRPIETTAREVLSLLDRA